MTDLVETTKRWERGRVLVAGAGIAGLTLTRLLHQRGIAVSAFERRGAPASEGFAVNLPGNAVAALTRFGLREELEQYGSPTRRREYRDHHGKLLFEIDEDEFWGPDARPRCLRRADLLDLLSRDLPEELVGYGNGVDAAAHCATGVVASLSDGTVACGEMLIGADGIRSAFRGAVVRAAAPSAALLADASWRFTAPNPGIDCWTLWAGNGGMILLIPIDRGEVYGWVTTKTKDGLNGQRLTKTDSFAKFPPLVRKTLATLLEHRTAAIHSPLQEVRIPRWSRDRVVLIGDAAHATAPVWAQGAALAFEDAETLADLLTKEDDWNGVGRAFERLRRPRVDHVRQATDRMSRAARLPGWLAGRLLPYVGPRAYQATYGPLRAPPPTTGG